MDAVRLRPNDAEIRNLLAVILRKLGRPREAVDHLRAVVAINPRDVEPVIALASCMRDANLFDEARQVCTAALQMIPDHPEFKRILDGLPPPARHDCYPGTNTRHPDTLHAGLPVLEGSKWAFNLWFHERPFRAP
jgi:tetratricopeptide (TPR) repeat protein